MSPMSLMLLYPSSGPADFVRRVLDVRDERVAGRSGLAKSSMSPALVGAVRLHSATVPCASADYGKASLVACAVVFRRDDCMEYRVLGDDDVLSIRRMWLCVVVEVLAHVYSIGNQPIDAANVIWDRRFLMICRGPAPPLRGLIVNPAIRSLSP